MTVHEWVAFVSADVWDFGEAEPKASVSIELRELRARHWTEAVAAALTQADDRLTRDFQYLEVTSFRIERVRVRGDGGTATEVERAPAGGASAAADAGEGAGGDGGAGAGDRGAGAPAT